MTLATWYNIPLSIVLLFLFKHIYRQSGWGRWLQVSPTANTPQLEAAFKTHPGLKLDCPQCRTKPISRRLGPATLPMATYTATWFKKHKSPRSVFFFLRFLCSKLTWMFRKLLCSSLSAMTFFHTSADLPMGRCARADRPCCALLYCAWVAWAPSLLTVPWLPLLCLREANLFGPLLVHNPCV